MDLAGGECASVCVRKLELCVLCVSAYVLGRCNSVSVLGGEAWVIFPLGLGKKETLYVMQ